MCKFWGAFSIILSPVRAIDLLKFFFYIFLLIIALAFCLVDASFAPIKSFYIIMKKFMCRSTHHHSGKIAVAANAFIDIAGFIAAVANFLATIANVGCS